MLNVGIDITPIMYGRGVSRYTANLVRALAAQRREVALSLYGTSFRQSEMLLKFAAAVPHRQAVIEKNPPTLQELYWRTLRIHPVAAKLPGIQVFHSWDWLQPPDKNLPLVSTVHDLAILRYPETAHPKVLKAHQHAWQVLKDRKAHIVAVSHATKRDIIELLRISSERIHVVYEALPSEAIEATEKLTEEQYDALKQKLHLNRPYLFFVGTREPRKNLHRLIEAWQPLAKSYDLIIAGEAGWDETNQTKHENLRFLGKVSDAELVVLYGEAELLAYPSLSEGFGLPILEAFYHGTPVVTSNASAMPEVAGNAAELVDPLSVESIRKGMTTILNESVEAQQQRLQKMIIRLHRFSWTQVAEEMIRVYHLAAQA